MMSTRSQFQGQPKPASEKRRAAGSRRFSLVLAASLMALAALPSANAGSPDVVLGVQVRTVFESASRFVNDVRLIYQIGQLADPDVVNAAQPLQGPSAGQFQDCSLDSAALPHAPKSEKSRL